MAERAKIHSYLTVTGVRPLTENVLVTALEFQSQVGLAKRRAAADAKRRWLTVCGAVLAMGLIAVAAFYLFHVRKRSPP